MRKPSSYPIVVISGLLACLFAVSCERQAAQSQQLENQQPGMAVRGEGLPFYSGADLTPRWPPSLTTSSRDFHRIPPFRFTNQEGKQITDETFRGKIYVADFFFTGCGGICPVMTKNLAKVQEAFASDEDLLILSHSVTPEKDNVEMLKGYADLKGVRNGKWHLVTGDRNEIYKLARKSYFADDSSGSGGSDFVHSERLFLIDRDRRIRGVYSGTLAFDVVRLISDIKTLKTEGGS
ncbi:MAG: SCO family protein [Planctomycetota bacterium]